MINKFFNKAIAKLTRIDVNNYIDNLSKSNIVKNQLNDLLEYRDIEIKENKETIEIRDSQIKELKNTVKSLININTDLQNKIDRLIEQVNVEHDHSMSLDTLGNEKRIFIMEKQIMIDNNHKLTDEIKILEEKIKYRDKANDDLRVVRDSLESQLKKFQEEIIDYKRREEESLKKQNDIQRVTLNTDIVQDENSVFKEKDKILFENQVLIKFDGLLETDINIIIDKFNNEISDIKWIYDAEFNKYYEVIPKFFLQEEPVLIELRHRLEDYCTNHQGKPKFVCAICYEPVKLSGASGERGKVISFVHSHDNLNCPLQTGRKINVRSFIESRHYQHTASSYWNKIIHNQLGVFLPKTPGVTCFVEEPIISFNFNFASWRKPHFSCKFKGHQLVFEVQTNPSTIKVISARNLFYRKQSSFILWIFDDSFASSASLSLKDIFYANNRNLFVFDKIAQEKSDESNQLWLKCIWEEPYSGVGGILWEMKSSYITLDQLKYDSSNYIAYYYPSEEKFISLGGIKFYEVNLNDDSFQDYEDTFEEKRSANLERLKTKVLIADNGQNNDQDNVGFNEEEWYETDEDEDEDKKPVDSFESKNENNFQIADSKVSENRDLFRKYLQKKGFAEAFISEYLNILSGPIAEGICTYLIQKSFHFFSIKDKSFLQILFDYLFSLEEFKQMDYKENNKFSKAFDEYLQYRMLQKSSEKNGSNSNNKFSSILIFFTDSKKYGVRALPLSYKNDWKVNDRIRTEDGSEGCTIKYISSRSDYELSKIESAMEKIKYIPVHNQEPKSLFRNRTSLNTIMKALNSTLDTEQGKRFLKAYNCVKSDFEVQNVIRCFTALIVNGNHLSCKIIKKNETNTLTFDFLSKYMESEIKNVDLRFSILDKNFTYKIEGGEIILNKNGIDYTLKLLIPISFNDILTRIPKYINEIRK